MAVAVDSHLVYQKCIIGKSIRHSAETTQRHSAKGGVLGRPGVAGRWEGRQDIKESGEQCDEASA